MIIYSKKLREITQSFFDKRENESQAAEYLNSIFGPDTKGSDHVQFRFRRFRSIAVWKVGLTGNYLLCAALPQPNSFFGRVL